ncbi:MAG: class I SAM-dependent methyltransferase [Bacteroidota bacterium]
MNEGQKTTVRLSYNEQASNYAARRMMQTGNLHRLLDLVQQRGLFGERNELRVLDVGCGNAVCCHVLRERFESVKFDYTGIDLSDELIRLGRESLGDDAELIVGDAESMPFEHGAFDLVLSNSVLHWLNVPSQGLSPAKAIAECSRVLSPDGLLAMSISGAGTAGRLLDAYNAVVPDFGPNNVVAGTRLDPIGSMSLSEVVQLVEATGMSVVSGTLNYEPVEYPAPVDYLKDVRAYGYRVFTRPAGEERREELWAALSSRFSESVAERPYRHEQYMIYALALRPTQESSAGRAHPSR